MEYQNKQADPQPEQQAAAAPAPVVQAALREQRCQEKHTGNDKRWQEKREDAAKRRQERRETMRALAHRAETR